MFRGFVDGELLKSTFSNLGGTLEGLESRIPVKSPAHAPDLYQSRPRPFGGTSSNSKQNH